MIAGVRIGTALMVAAIGTAGCNLEGIPVVNNRVEPQTVRRARVIVMPPVALLYTLDASGDREAQDEASKQIESNVARYLGPMAAQAGARMADSPNLAAC